MKEKAFVSIIVYVNNNVNLISYLLVPLDNFIDSKFENYELIAVNDASSDGSGCEIKNISSRLKRGITLINLAWRHGPERGMLSGIDLSIGDFIIEFEMDRVDYDFQLLYELFKEANKGIDIVSACRAKNGLHNNIKWKVFNSISYLSFNMNNETARIVSRRTINSLLDMNERVVNRGILYHLSGFPNRVILYKPIKMKMKAKKPTLNENLSLTMDIVVSYSNIGTDISVIMAFFFSVMAILLGAYALFMYFTYKWVVPGWTTTILFMLICFFGVFFVLGVQGKYISSILIDIKERRPYVIRSVERYMQESPLNEQSKIVLSVTT